MKWRLKSPSISIVAPWQGVAHNFRTGPKRTVILDIFSPPREEYRKAGTGFGG